MMPKKLGWLKESPVGEKPDKDEMKYLIAQTQWITFICVCIIGIIISAIFFATSTT